MENSIYVGLSYQAALEAQMDLVSNNIANMSTPGYRAKNMVFTEFLSQPEGPKSRQLPIAMVMDYGHYQSELPGPLQMTGNPLDLALEGRGWFGVQTPEGVMYTRGGNFRINTEGTLVTSRGEPVAGEGGGAITIPSDAKEIRIGKNGDISTQSGSIGKLMVVEFANTQDLETAGNGLYKIKANAINAVPLDSPKTTITQGALEGSNVQPVLEMTRMIDVARAYQNASRILQSEHERERGMIQRLSRANG